MTGICTVLPSRRWAAAGRLLESPVSRNCSHFSAPRDRSIRPSRAAGLDSLRVVPPTHAPGKLAVGAYELHDERRSVTHVQRRQQDEPGYACKPSLAAQAPQSIPSVRKNDKGAVVRAKLDGPGRCIPDRAQIGVCPNVASSASTL